MPLELSVQSVPEILLQQLSKYQTSSNVWYIQWKQYHYKSFSDHCQMLIWFYSFEGFEGCDVHLSQAARQ